METIVTPEQMRFIDGDMIGRQGIPGLVLMEHAAAAVAKKTMELARPNRTVYLFCGGGNNGGDGLSAYRQLVIHGVLCRGILLCPPETLEGDAKKQYDMAVGSGLPVEVLLDADEVRALPLLEAGAVVDAMFGTGLNRAMEGRFQAAAERMNGAGVPVIAVDIPSGVDGETAKAPGTAVRATATVTFQHRKIGHVLYPGREYCGEVTVAPIGLGQKPETAIEILSAADAAALLPKRKPGSHKGNFGRGVLVAGSGPYGGAALLSARAALRGGCGVLVAAVPKTVYPLFADCPGAIVVPAGAGADWDQDAAGTAAGYFDNATAIAVGPGMGTGPGIPLILEQALLANKPLVIDADGLNALSKQPALLGSLHGRVILTPHPGEMSRLTGKPLQVITDGPINAAKTAAKEWGCTVLLKGAVSVIASPQGRTFLNEEGTAGLAKGGSGDVLTGMILALLCQGLDADEAACLGAYLLGRTAKRALALLGERALTPMDVIGAI